MANGGEQGVSQRNVVPVWLKSLWDTHPLVVVAGLVVAGLAVSVALVWPITDLIAAHDVGLIIGPKRAAALQAAREAVRTQLLTLGAGLFAAGALVFTALNFTLSREGQVTDRYTKAIGQLGSKEQLDVCIGGIYALERVARDSPKDHPSVMEVLSTFIRDHSQEQWPPPETGTDAVPQRATRPDVQAAITVIGRRNSRNDRERIVLAGANLTGANLTGGNFAGANLTDVDFGGADLIGANLRGANLLRAILDTAHLIGADLTGADCFSASLLVAILHGAKLVGAKLIGAKLFQADLGGADLTDADLTRADLTGANPIGAKLTRAGLTDANLTGAGLTGADLTGAILNRADLTGANLIDAKLIGASMFRVDLTRANLTRANLTRANLAPDNLAEADQAPANLSDADLTGADLTGAILAGVIFTGAKFSANATPPEGWVRDAGSGLLRRANPATDDSGG
jgi:uncharacterized protein YjbI with pentapeptide repeats